MRLPVTRTHRYSATAAANPAFAADLSVADERLATPTRVAACQRGVTPPRAAQRLLGIEGNSPVRNHLLVIFLPSFEHQGGANVGRDVHACCVGCVHRRLVGPDGP